MRLTLEQYNRLINVSKKSKYHNNKIDIDGHKFDSTKEGKRYNELKLLERAGAIKDLELQKVFELQPGYTKNGKKIRPITYKADFVYLNLANNKIIVEDVKGFKTKEYLLKKKIFEYVYEDLEIKEV